MNKVAILTDFDNWFPNKLDDLPPDAIIDFVNRLVQRAIDTCDEVEEISALLYGGWYADTVLTPKASFLSALLPTLERIFPVRSKDGKRLIHGNVNLATQLYDSSFVWYNSYREHFGIPKLRVDHSKLGDLCDANDDHCPIKIMKRFTKHKGSECRIEGCSVKHSEVFFQKEQKYVDTMLVCDIITIGLDDEYTDVYLASDDCDLFPAFATLNRLMYTLGEKNIRKHLVIKNANDERPYKRLLAPFDVDVTVIDC